MSNPLHYFSASEPSTLSVERKKSLRCPPVSAHRVGFGGLGRLGRRRLGRRQRRLSLQRHARSISRRQDHSRGLAARGRERRPERTVADFEMLAVRTGATVSSLRQWLQLIADGRDRGVRGRRTRAGGTRGGGGCGEQERSTDGDCDLVRHLWSSLLATCWRRVGFVPLMQMVTRQRTPLRGNRRPGMHHGYRVHRVSAFPIQCRVAH
jgi:hypothetical protein